MYAMAELDTDATLGIKVSARPDVCRGFGFAAPENGPVCFDLPNDGEPRKRCAFVTDGRRDDSKHEGAQG